VDVEATIHYDTLLFSFVSALLGGGHWSLDLLGQVNLYYRVSELCTESEETKEELGLTEAPPLVEW
jgi:hypothetical protein